MCSRACASTTRDESAPQDAEVRTLLVGGSACTDYSFYGSQQQSAGPTALFLLLFLRLAAEFKPMMVLLENVVGFPMSIVIDVLGQIYDFTEMILQADAAGFPVERRRKYMLGVLRIRYETLSVEYGYIRFCLFFLHL